MPPVPADTFVLLGAFLAESGRADPVLVFLFTWLANVGSAMAVYGLAYRHGAAVLETPAGHWLLKPRQIQRIELFYSRWGTPAIFLSRFLPALRALVPVFAGLTHVPPARVLVPLALASAIWYGALVYLGALAGRNWEAIMALFDRASTGLLVVATVLIAALLTWWWRTRHEHEDAA